MLIKNANVLPCLRLSILPYQEIEHICIRCSQAINVFFCVFNQLPCEQAEDSQDLNSTAAVMLLS